MNKVWITGRLTAKPEIKKSVNDKEYCNFSIAVPKDKEHVNYIKCIAWGIQAENLCKYQNKGSLIGILGELNNREYEDTAGTKRTILEINCNQIEYLGGVYKEELNPYKEEKNKPFIEFGNEIEKELD